VVRFDGGDEILGRVRDVGEPWTCGFVPSEMRAYLAARGFALIEDLSADEYRAGSSTCPTHGHCYLYSWSRQTIRSD
jgi:hypothetical protein